MVSLNDRIKNILKSEGKGTVKGKHIMPDGTIMKDEDHKQSRLKQIKGGAPKGGAPKGGALVGGGQIEDFRSKFNQVKYLNGSLTQLRDCAEPGSIREEDVDEEAKHTLCVEAAKLVGGLNKVVRNKLATIRSTASPPGGGPLDRVKVLSMINTDYTQYFMLYREVVQWSMGLTQTAFTPASSIISRCRTWPATWLYRHRQQILSETWPPTPDSLKEQYGLQGMGKGGKIWGIPDHLKALYGVQGMGKDEFDLKKWSADLALMKKQMTGKGKGKGQMKGGADVFQNGIVIEETFYDIIINRDWNTLVADIIQGNPLFVSISGRGTARFNQMDAKLNQTINLLEKLRREWSQGAAGNPLNDIDNATLVHHFGVALEALNYQPLVDAPDHQGVGPAQGTAGNPPAMTTAGINIIPFLAELNNLIIIFSGQSVTVAGPTRGPQHLSQHRGFLGYMRTYIIQMKDKSSTLYKYMTNPGRPYHGHLDQLQSDLNRFIAWYNTSRQNAININDKFMKIKELLTTIIEMSPTVTKLPPQIRNDLRRLLFRISRPYPSPQSINPPEALVGAQGQGKTRKNNNPTNNIMDKKIMAELKDYPDLLEGLKGGNREERLTGGFLPALALAGIAVPKILGMFGLGKTRGGTIRIRPDTPAPGKGSLAHKLAGFLAASHPLVSVFKKLVGMGFPKKKGVKLLMSKPVKLTKKEGGIIKKVSEGGAFKGGNFSSVDDNIKFNYDLEGSGLLGSLGGIVDGLTGLGRDDAMRGNGFLDMFARMNARKAAIRERERNTGIVGGGLLDSLANVVERRNNYYETHARPQGGGLLGSLGGIVDGLTGLGHEEDMSGNGLLGSLGGIVDGLTGLGHEEDMSGGNVGDIVGSIIAKAIGIMGSGIEHEEDMRGNGLLGSLGGIIDGLTGLGKQRAMMGGDINFTNEYGNQKAPTRASLAKAGGMALPFGMGARGRGMAAGGMVAGARVAGAKPCCCGRGGSAMPPVEYGSADMAGNTEFVEPAGRQRGNVYGMKSKKVGGKHYGGAMDSDIVLGEQQAKAKQTKASGMAAGKKKKALPTALKAYQDKLKKLKKSGYSHKEAQQILRENK